MCFFLGERLSYDSSMLIDEDCITSGVSLEVAIIGQN